MKHYKQTIKRLEQIMVKRIKKDISPGVIPETIQKLKDGFINKDDIFYIKQLLQAHD